MMIGVFALAKAALRISSTDAYDAEITSLCEAAEADLRNAGVHVPTQSEPLLARAIVLYVKANFGSDDDSERYSRSYDALKCSLMLSGDYKEGGYSG